MIQFMSFFFFFWTWIISHQNILQFAIKHELFCKDLLFLWRVGHGHFLLCHCIFMRIHMGAVCLLAFMLCSHMLLFFPTTYLSMLCLYLRFSFHVHASWERDDLLSPVYKEVFHSQGSMCTVYSSNYTHWSSIVTMQCRLIFFCFVFIG